MKRVKREPINETNVTHEFNNLHFPSQRKDTYRCRVDTFPEGFTFWLENKSTKKQWHSTVKNIDECGPSSIPKQVVKDFLKMALDFASNPQNASTENGDAAIDLIFVNDEAILTLVLSISNIWKPEFTFALLPVQVDKVDILESKLRDAQDEIQQLLPKEDGGKKTAFLSVSSMTSCAWNQIVSWDATSPKVFSDSHFTLSADCRNVTILKDGIYQVNVRLAGINNSNGQGTGLQLNGVDIATCNQSDANHHQNTAQILEIMHCKIGDVLRVRCGFNSNSLVSPTSNRFTILYLGI